MLLRIGLLLLLVVTLSCDNKEQAHTPSNVPLARVYNQYLYKSDLERVFPGIMDANDSSKRTEQYIQNWISKQLMVAEAEAHPSYNKAEIDSKVLDYRYDLIVHNFVEALVKKQLNTAVSDEEIQHYYQKHQEDFLLKYNIVKGKFIRLPKDVPELTKIKSLINSNKKQDLAELKAYCAQYAKDYSLDTSIWMKWDEIIKGTRFNKASNKTKLIKNCKFIESKEDKFVCYFKIDAYKTLHDVPPLEFVKNQIVNLIVHQRKINLAKKLEEDILQNAKANNKYTIYAH